MIGIVQVAWHRFVSTMYTEDEYEDALESLRGNWSQYLEPKGVQWPSKAMEPALVFLFVKMPEPLSQDDITTLYEAIGLQYNKQVRHLVDDGWDLHSGNKRFKRGVHDPNLAYNQMRLNSISEVNPIWERRAKISRQYEMAKGDWKSILELFSERGCAVCGRQSPSYDKGHLNPLDSVNPENIVPMCAECNIWGGVRDVTFKLDPRTLIARPVRFGVDLGERRCEG